MPHETRKLRYEDMRAMLITDYRNRGVGMLEQRKNKETGAVKDHVDGFQFLDLYFKGMSAMRITTPVLQKFIEKRKTEDEAENGTINRNLAVLRKMMNLAKQAALLSSVPYFPSLDEKGNVRTGFVEDEQFNVLVAKLPGRLHLLILFLYRTGWRVTSARTWFPPTAPRSRCPRCSSRTGNR